MKLNSPAGDNSLMAVKPVILKPYVHIRAELPLRRRIQVPQELPQLPKTALLKIGYRLLNPGESPRQTLGYLIPGLGIYDPAGQMVKRLRGTRGLDFYYELPPKLVAGVKRTLAAVVTERQLRFAVDIKSKNIVGILRSVEPAPQSPHFPQKF